MARIGASEILNPNEHSYDAIVIGSGIGGLTLCLPLWPLKPAGSGAFIVLERHFQNRRIYAYVQPARRLDLGRSACITWAKWKKA